MHERFRSSDPVLYAALRDIKARLNLRDPFGTTFIPAAGSGSPLIPETPPSSDTEVVSSIAELESPATDNLDHDQRNPSSRSLENLTHGKFRANALATSNQALASLERNWNPSSDRRIEPLKLDSSSTGIRSQKSEQITSQTRDVRSSIGIGAAPPPRFINPAKITKAKDEERGTASYLNQQQLYRLRQQETRIVRKLETKSIPQLQVLQHKALASHASNKIKNLIQKTLFEKHLAEMKEWQGQVDVWSKDCRDEARTGTDDQET